MAGGAVLCVESAEVHNLIRCHWLRTFLRLTVWSAATREEYEHENRECREMWDPAHGRSSPLPRGGTVPGASIPPRKTNHTFSRVGMLSWRTTTRPATTPKATCDATNQNQSIRLASSGFSSPRIVYSSPDHSTGAMSPPSTIGRRGNMGSIAP